MAQKVTLKMILETIRKEEYQDNIYRRFQKICPPDTYDENDVSIAFRRIIKDGTYQTATKCKHCNKIYFTTDSTYGYDRAEYKECPYCKESSFVITYGQRIFNNYKSNYSFNSTDYKFGFNKNLHFFVFYDEEINTYVIANIHRNYVQKIEEDIYFDLEDYSKNTFLDYPLESEDEIESLFIFSDNYGLKYFDIAQNKFFQKIGDNIHSLEISNSHITNEYKELLTHVEDLLGYKTSVLITSLLAYNKKLQSKKPSKEKKVVSVYDYCRDITKEEVVERIKNNFDIDNSFSFISSASGKKIKYVNICSCGDIFEGEETLLKNFKSDFRLSRVCPKCGRKIEKDINCVGNRTLINRFEVNIWKKEDEAITIHFANISFSINPQSMKMEITPIKLTKIVVLTEKGTFVFNKDVHNSWVKVSNIYIPQRYDYGRSKNLNTEEELISIVNSTEFLVKRGVPHAWGISPYENNAIENMGTLTKDSFIYQSYKKPYLEFAIKCGLKRITKELIWESATEKYSKSTNIYNMFDITKSTLKIARIEDLSIKDMLLVKKCYKLQSNFSLEMWKRLSNEDFNTDSFLRTMESTKTSITKGLEYLQSVYDNQCIPKSAAITIFNDYYQMAKKIGFNLNDNAIKFPNSLKKEHDKALFAYNVIKEELKIKAFKENSFINKKYEYSFENLVVIVPQEPKEVITEGQLQHHCVASYVSQIENGKTCICFIRKKDNLDEPYYTCEVRDEIILQVKGFSNKYPDDKTLINFIEKWAKSKNLKIEYMKH